MWERCLGELKAIVNPQIVSYGAYETQFLRRMRARYIIAADDMAFVDLLIKMSVNLVGCIYGRIYFPTFSNSLKEVADISDSSGLGHEPRAVRQCYSGEHGSSVGTTGSRAN